ncbi:MAG TPA: NfeD family protein [Acidimicrobiia bacterium]|nr:NfeD family protein [Acidimicrobiia bacterium]
MIDPANADLIKTSIKNAERDGATAVVFQMDASGAVDVDMNDLYDAFTNAKVPVTVWVGPSGGGARGAAALLARSADYAAVASGATLGAVDPIRYDDPSFTMDVPLKTVDAEAHTLIEFIGSLEQSPLKLKTMKVVELDGKQVRQPAGEVHFHKLTLGAQLAHTLDSPWVAYFLFVVGLALIVFEFFTAGVGIAGAVGAVALLGGCFGFSHLPAQPWAIALLVIGVFGMAIDVQAGGLGAWTFIGGIALTIGSIFLYGGSSRLDPKWWVLLFVIGGTVVFMLSGMTAMIRSRFSTPTIGREELVGELGEAAADVAPDGVVRIREALWKARTNRATPIHAGDTVRVVSIEGLTLEVEPETGGAIDYRERRRRS